MDVLNETIKNNISSQFPRIHKVNSELGFQNTDHLFTVIDKLDQIDEEWERYFRIGFDDLFNYLTTTYPCHSFDKLSLENSIEEHYIVPEDVVYTHFNDHLVFNSMYMNLMYLEEQWLNQENPQSNNDPTNVDFDEDLWPVLTLGGYVNVDGQSILTDEAFWWGDGISTFPGIEADCLYDSREKFKEQYRPSGERIGFKFTIKHNPGFLNGINSQSLDIKGKAKALKKKRKRWKKDRNAKLTAEIQNTLANPFNNGECNLLADYFVSERKSRDKKVRVRVEPLHWNTIRKWDVEIGTGNDINGNKQFSLLKLCREDLGSFDIYLHEDLVQPTAWKGVCNF